MRTSSGERILQAAKARLLPLPLGLNRALSGGSVQNVADLNDAEKPSAPACFLPAPNIWYTTELNSGGSKAMIERTIFREEHAIFRESVRRFVDREIVPFHAQWEKDGIVPRELWLKAGAEGLLCCTVPEQYGGLGLDYLFDVVVFEELWRSGASGPGFLIHTDLVATYLLSFGTEEQKREWLPKMVSGEAIGSLGMTEPPAGSDLKANRTRAGRDGNDFVLKRIG